MDLIETSWNVKFVDDVDEELVEVGFNRNIVECKGIRLALRSYRSMDLIETSWNVKVKSFVLNSEENLDLIETLWNVKTLFAMNGSRGMGFNRDIVECKVRWNILSRTFAI